MSAAESARPLARQCAWQSRRSRLRIDRACDGQKPSTESECAGHCSFRLLLVENRRDQVRRHRLEMRRLHRITRAAFRERTNSGRVAKQFGKRNLSVDDRQVTTCLNAVNAAATTAQVATNVTLDRKSVV